MPHASLLFGLLRSLPQKGAPHAAQVTQTLNRVSPSAYVFLLALVVNGRKIVAIGKLLRYCALFVLG